MDRNNVLQCNTVIDGQSLSARRAWIEIVYPGTWSGSILVALRKESVDRNTIINVKERGRKLSLSARRAWIEMVRLVLQIP